MEETMKPLFYFSLAVLLAVFLFWLGQKFLFFPKDEINGGVLLALGIFLVLGGIFMFRGIVWQAVVIMIVIGLYFCMRAAGFIEWPLVARLVGVGAWVAAGGALYLAWPYKKHKARTEPEDEAPAT